MKLGVKAGRVLRVSVLVSVASAALLLGAASPAPADTLDQQQMSTDGLDTVTSMGGDYSDAQTFTAGLSGLLDRVDLVVDQTGAAAPLTVEIRTVASGCPSGTVLASTQLPTADVPERTASKPPFDPITFSSPAAVVPGNEYAIVWYSASGSTYDTYGSITDVYAGGQGCWSASTPPSTWTTQASWDFAFRTYVAPIAASAPGNSGQGNSGSPSSPGATGLRAAALASCKKRAHKRHWPHKRLKRCKKLALRLPV
jgi:hypothetical protein